MAENTKDMTTQSTATRVPWLNLSEFSPQLLMDVVRSSVKWVVLFFIVAGVLGYLYLHYTPKVYQVDASLMSVTQKETQLLGVEDVLQDDMMERNREYRIIRSEIILGPVIDSLGLDVEYYAEGRLVSSELYTLAPFRVEKLDQGPFAVQRIDLLFHEDGALTMTSKSAPEIVVTGQPGDTLSIGGSRLIVRTVPGTTIPPEKPFFIRLLSANTALQKMQQELGVSLAQNNTIQLWMRHSRPEKSLDIIRAVCSRFILYDRRKKTQGIDQTIDFLDRQIEDFSKEYYGVQDTIIDFKADIGFSTPDQKLATSVTRWEELRRESMNLDLQLALLGWISENMELSTVALKVPPFSTSFFQPVASDLEKLVELQQQRSRTLQSRTPNHPDVQYLDEQIDRKERQIDVQIALLRENVQSEKARIDSEISELQGLIQRLPEREVAFSRLLREEEIKENFFFNLIENRIRYLISKAGIVSDYIQLKSPTLQREPVAPNTLLAYGLSVGLGLLASILLIAVRYLLHTKISYPEEVSRVVTAPILGTIPNIPGSDQVSQIVVLDSPKSSISEAFRGVRSNMEFVMSHEGKRNVIMTTSTVPGEGKTFIGINLASIITLLDKRVIMIDFDLRKPRIHKVFGTTKGTGTSSVLIGKADWQDCVQQSDIPNLDYITSGPIPPNPAELVKTAATGRLIDDLAAHYDYVFLDTPPVGIVTDALDLAKLADYPLYVVRANFSEKTFLHNIDHLRYNMGLTDIGVVLNAFGGKRDGYGYGYGYGYDYGYGYGRTYGAGYYTEDAGSSEGRLQRLLRKILRK